MHKLQSESSIFPILFMNFSSSSHFDIFHIQFTKIIFIGFLNSMCFNSFLKLDLRMHDEVSNFSLSQTSKGLDFTTEVCKK